MKLKFIGAIIALGLWTQPIQAATFNIDLTDIGGTSSITPGCYCDPVQLYISPTFNLPPGNTYNFGTVTLPYIQAGVTPDAGPYQRTTYFTGNVEFGDLSFAEFGEDPRGFYFCGDSGEYPGTPVTACNPPSPLTVSLIYPTGGNVQVAFWAGDYAPPTPLPAAFPLFATGLGLIGLFGWRGKRKSAATVEAARS